MLASSLLSSFVALLDCSGSFTWTKYQYEKREDQFSHSHKTSIQRYSARHLSVGVCNAIASMSDMAVIRPRRESDLKPLAVILCDVYAQTGYPVGLAGIEDAVQFIRIRNEKASVENYVVVDDEVAGHMSIVTSLTSYPITETTVYNRPSDVPGEKMPWIIRDGNYEFDCLCLRTFFVDPGKRGRGYGKKPMLHAISKAKSIEKRLVLDVIKKDVAAIALYEKLGWLRIGETVYIEQGSGTRYSEWLYLSPPQQES